MKKWLVRMKRELDEDCADVMPSEEYPTETQLIEFFREMGIEDNPEYSRYYVDKEV